MRIEQEQWEIHERYRKEREQKYQQIMDRQIYAHQNSHSDQDSGKGKQEKLCIELVDRSVQDSRLSQGSIQYKRKISKMRKEIVELKEQLEIRDMQKNEAIKVAQEKEHKMSRFF